MKFAVFSVTANGNRHALRILSMWEREGHVGKAFTLSAYAVAGQETFPSLSAILPQLWRTVDVLCFVTATGIAVRSIAPLLVSKATDLAVLVCDEGGNFVIPLASGHLGGGNELAASLAKAIGAMPVITTATDLSGVFAVDSWARRQGLIVAEPERIKAVSGRLLAGKPVGLRTSFPVLGEAPPLFSFEKMCSVGVVIDRTTDDTPFSTTLHLLPKNLVLGFGCRRGTSEAAIAAAVEEVFAERGWDARRIFAICTADRKADEAGLLAFAAGRKLPLHCYDTATLQTAEGKFTPSAFVQQTLGVDNVCERAAAVFSPNGNRILDKTTRTGITLAVVELPISLHWS